MKLGLKGGISIDALFIYMDFAYMLCPGVEIS